MLIIQFLLICTTMIGLPGNLISLATPAIFLFLNYITWKTFIIILCLIGVGEILEIYIGYIGSKIFGISGKSFWTSVIFAIIFGILMAPIFFGIGSIIGVFFGTFLGTFIYEYTHTKNFPLSLKLGFLSLFSRLTGTFIKFCIGLSTIYIQFMALIK